MAVNKKNNIHHQLIVLAWLMMWINARKGLMSVHVRFPKVVVFEGRMGIKCVGNTS